MPVRWALEEVGQPHEVRLVSFDEMKEPAHLALQPFGQIPTFEHGGHALFESGAIILHIAESWPGLLPDDATSRMRAIGWMFAAASTVEPVVVDRQVTLLNEGGEAWRDMRLPLVDARIDRRLAQLSVRLADEDWLDGDFTAGDLAMISVLRRLAGSPLLKPYPNLCDYVARGEARPAFQRAFAAQRAVFEDAVTKGE